MAIFINRYNIFFLLVSINLGIILARKCSIKHCKKCSKKNICKICKKGFKLNDEQNKCIKIVNSDNSDENQVIPHHQPIGSSSEQNNPTANAGQQTKYSSQSSQNNKPPIVPHHQPIGSSSQQNNPTGN